MWFYDPGNYNDFRQHLSNTDWDLLQNDDINVWVTHFTNYLLDTCKQFIPNRVVTVRPNDPSWFISDLKRLIRKRKRLYRKAETTNNVHDWLMFRTPRNESITKIRQAKEQAILDVASSLLENRNSKYWWSTLNFFLSTPNRHIPPIEPTTHLCMKNLIKQMHSTTILPNKNNYKQMHHPNQHPHYTSSIALCQIFILLPMNLN